MTFIPNWEEFEKSAEMLYLRDPLNTRYTIKYSHTKGVFVVKITDNKKVIFHINVSFSIIILFILQSIVYIISALHDLELSK